MNSLCNALLWPVKGFDPWLGMAIVSAFTALLLVFIFKLVSNQQKLSAAKKKLIARLLEFAVYKEDTRTCLSAFGRAMTANIQYLRHIMLPLAVCMAPMFFILVQMGTRFAHRPLRKGETAVLEVNLSNVSTGLNDTKKIITSENLETTGPVRIPALNQIAWRLTVLSEGPAYFKLKNKTNTIEKRIATGKGLIPIPDLFPSPNQYWHRIINPSASSLPQESNTKSVHVIYPLRTLSIGLYDIHWLVAFVALTLIFGYSFQKLFRITI